MTTTVTLKQAETLIASTGTQITYLLRGAPGIGKTSLQTALAQRFPEYHVAYIDVANLDLGDAGMPVVDREKMVTHYAPNARFGIYPGQTKPVLLMLDELTKAPKPVLNMLLPVLLERRLGDVALPPGSIVFATGNLDTDGVGDNLPAHAANRMTELDVANPTAEEWVQWGAANGIAAEVMAFAMQYPAVFARYDQLGKSDVNPYIFNPRAGHIKHFCSPRSLAKASTLVQARAVLGDALLPALIGTIGESAARDLEATVLLGDTIPSIEAVTKDPANTKLPGSAAAYFLMAFKLVGHAKDTNIDAIMTYVDRWDAFEARTLFVYQMASAKATMAFKSRAFVAAAAAVGRFF